MIVPTLRVGMHPVTLRVAPLEADAERPGRHSHAERGNDHYLTLPRNTPTRACNCSGVAASSATGSPATNTTRDQIR